MEQRVLCQPEVICYRELLQWAGMFSCIGPCDSGAAAVCWRRSSVDCPAADGEDADAERLACSGAG